MVPGSKGLRTGGVEDFVQLVVIEPNISEVQTFGD